MVALAGITWIGVSGAGGGAGAGKAAAMLSFSENEDGRTAQVRVGETIEVTLPENASTGYSWTVDRLDADIVQQHSAESRNPAKAIGASGTIVFTFEAVKAGTGEIALKYWRSWEGDASVSKRFRIRLSVQT
jgi:inhibitor of cysteine peptidase